MTRAPGVDATHDPGRRSWIASANADSSDFPIQNLPLGRFRIDGGPARAGVAIGDMILDLGKLHDTGLLEGQAAEGVGVAAGGNLRGLLTLGRSHATALRRQLSDLLSDQSAARSAVERSDTLVPAAAAEMMLPLDVRQFSDMCVSTFHIGRRRGNDADGQPICPPVFRTLPVGYDGRASSVVISGTHVRRPNGVWEKSPGSGDIAFGPEPRQDYELELGIWIGGPGNALGMPVGVRAAAEMIWGYSLLNDWSARGIQMWENMLGPFLGKSLATTVSPWIVTADALAPFRVPAFARAATDPPVPPHLNNAADQFWGALDIELTASLSSARMTNSGDAPFLICGTNFRHMYWTPAQMVSHHTSNGCSLAAGDLLGSGTCSGPAIEEAACLLERAPGGPWTLPSGEPRLWLEDGDTVALRGRAVRDGFVSIGFGEAVGTIQPAVAWP